MPSVVACDMSVRFKKSAFIAFQDLEKCTASTNFKSFQHFQRDVSQLLFCVVSLS